MTIAEFICETTFAAFDAKVEHATPVMVIAEPDIPSDVLTSTNGETVTALSHLAAITRNIAVRVMLTPTREHDGPIHVCDVMDLS